jgi:uncharacterized repeat protein (TIGR03803 family)
VHTFKGPTNNDGANPTGVLTADAAGNFYGVTAAGGNRRTDCGTVFKLTPGSSGNWTESVLYRFRGRVGCAPTGNLIFDAAGNLYGITGTGGIHHRRGIVFKLAPSPGAWTITVLHTFPGAGHIDGSQPAGIIFDGAGNIDGVTTFGGTRHYNGAGVAFQLVQNSQGQWTER